MEKEGHHLLTPIINNKSADYIINSGQDNDYKCIIKNKNDDLELNFTFITHTKGDYHE